MTKKKETENTSPAAATSGAAQNLEVSGVTEAVPVTVKTMLDAGAHFGHQTHRWNPKMTPFIYGERNGIHVINLDLTTKLWDRARKYVVDTVSRGGTVLFVGTKPQARDVVGVEAARCGAYYVTTRWLGGTLSNFQTIKNSIDRMRKMEDLLLESSKPDTKVKITKKERLTMSRSVEKLSASLGGIREMRRLPDIVFVIDVIKEDIAVKEARRLHIPIMGLVDTNADPTTVDFPIPANDDAARTIKLFVAAIADAIKEGRVQFESRRVREPSHNGKNHGNGATNGAVAAAPAVATAAAQ